MPKEQYMCQLCANHGIFNQPKKGHKQKCPHRNCPCELCALNTKRRALDQIERQLKNSTGPPSSSTPTTTLTTALGSLSDDRPDCLHRSSSSSSNSPPSSISSQATGSPRPDPSCLGALPTVPSILPPPFPSSPFSALFASPSPFFPFMPPTSPPNFMLQQLAMQGLLAPSSSSAGGPPLSPFTAPTVPSSSSAHSPTAAKGGGGPVHSSRSHASSNPYAVPLQATISRKTMREALKNRSLTAALENIRAKSNEAKPPPLLLPPSFPPMEETKEDDKDKDESKGSIFHSVEQLAR